MIYKCPLIVVEDIARARFFYETLLGQKVKADYGENLLFQGDFAIHQKKHFAKLLNDLPILKKAHNFELYFEDDDLERIVAHLKEHNIVFVHEIVEQPWKQQVIRFYDFDDHIIEIGERLEHVAYRLWLKNVPMNEICAVTYLSEEEISRAIQEYNAACIQSAEENADGSV